MTRKQALLKAIEALSKEEGNEEAISLLNDLHDELPLIHWTDKSIRDAVEQFILDNGRNPTATDFKKAGMPPHPVIKLKYKITLGEWLEQNYPTVPVDPETLHKEQTELFIKEYMRIQSKSSEMFNKEKTSECKGWFTIAKYNDVKTWGDLLKKLDLRIFSGRRYRGSTERITPKFEVFITTDFKFLNKLIEGM